MYLMQQWPSILKQQISIHRIKIKKQHKNAEEQCTIYVRIDFKFTKVFQSDSIFLYLILGMIECINNINRDQKILTEFSILFSILFKIELIY